MTDKRKRTSVNNKKSGGGDKTPSSTTEKSAKKVKQQKDALQEAINDVNNNTVDNHQKLTVDTTTTKTTSDEKEESKTPVPPTTPSEKKATPYPSFCRNYKVIQECAFDKIRLREFDTMCCDGAAIIEGFPDSSGNMVSVMTANYIIKEMNLPLVGDIISRHFTPLAVVTQGLPSHGARIYGNDKIVVFVSEYDVQDAEIQNSLVDAIYDFARRHRCSMIISCDGLVDDPTKEVKDEQLQIGITGGAGVSGGASGDEDEDDEESEGSHMLLLGGDDDENGGDDADKMPQSKEDLIKLLANATKSQQEYKGQLWFCTNDEDFSKKMVQLGHSPVRNLSVKHITGGILAEAIVKGITVACLFAPLDKHLQIGTRACISLIHCIDTLLSKRTGAKVIDTANIEKTAKEIEQKLEQVINKLGGLTEASQKQYHNMYM